VPQYFQGFGQEIMVKFPCLTMAESRQFEQLQLLSNETMDFNLRFSECGERLKIAEVPVMTRKKDRINPVPLASLVAEYQQRRKQ